MLHRLSVLNFQAGLKVGRACGVSVNAFSSKALTSSAAAPAIAVATTDQFPSSSSVVAGGLTDNVFPISTAGSWYDPNSIERRLRRKRNEARIDPTTGEPTGRSGLCIGAPTEEEAYMAAGAPGYDGGGIAVDVSTRAASVNVVPSSVPSLVPEAQSNRWVPRPPPPTHTPIPTPSPSPTPPAPHTIGTLIRVSSGIVGRAALPAFVRVWQLLALPIYATARGCVSARLVVGEDRHGGGGGDARADARAAAAGPRGGAATVVAITEWTDESAIEEAAMSHSYQKAMEQLGIHFRGAPTVSTLGQEVANVGIFGGLKPGGGMKPEAGSRSWAL